MTFSSSIQRFTQNFTAPSQILKKLAGISTSPIYEHLFKLRIFPTKLSNPQELITHQHLRSGVRIIPPRRNPPRKVSSPQNPPRKIPLRFLIKVYVFTVVFPAISHWPSLIYIFITILLIMYIQSSIMFLVSFSVVKKQN